MSEIVVYVCIKKECEVCVYDTTDCKKTKCCEKEMCILCYYSIIRTSTLKCPFCRNEDVFFDTFDDERCVDALEQRRENLDKERRAREEDESREILRLLSAPPPTLSFSHPMIMTMQFLLGDEEEEVELMEEVD